MQLARMYHRYHCCSRKGWKGVWGGEGGRVEGRVKRRRREDGGCRECGYICTEAAAVSAYARIENTRLGQQDVTCSYLVLYRPCGV